MLAELNTETEERACFDAARTLLSLREATVIAEVPEKRVRKDIETGVLTDPFVHRISDNRLCTHWTYVFTLAAVYGNVCLTGALRKIVLSKVADSTDLFSHLYVKRYKSLFDTKVKVEIQNASHLDFANLRINIDRYFSLDFSRVIKEIEPRLASYVYGLSRVEERSDVLGGEAVFKKSRLSVRHVGLMFHKGETMQNILSDYPYLEESDVEFARMYFTAHPPIGRPRICVDEDHDAFTPAA